MNDTAQSTTPLDSDAPMSTPTTPAEMADWLEQTFGDELWPSDEDAFGAVIAYLRSVPTDAQKIEALKAAAEAALLGNTGVRMWTRWGIPFRAHAREAGSSARKAMRLLGLPTE